MQLVKWISIEQFHNLRRSIKKRKKYIEQELGQKYDYPTIKYRPKVKLDGTCGIVQIDSEGNVTAQSRERILSIGKDNYEFCAWVTKNKSYFSILNRPPGYKLVIFGEWCGQGIQRRTAISKIGKKIFAIFAIQLGKEDDNNFNENSILYTDPEDINSKWLNYENIDINFNDIFVIPWLTTDSIALSFGNEDDLRKKVDLINELVNTVEEKDPWVFEQFGVEGIGEGIVMYPQICHRSVPRDEIAELIFKAKGKKHQVVKQEKPAQMDPQIIKNAQIFAEKFVTEARCEQGLSIVCQDGIDIKMMGPFLKWINNDILKESTDELTTNDLPWKQVSKQVSIIARNWYLNKVKTI